MTATERTDEIVDTAIAGDGPACGDCVAKAALDERGAPTYLGLSEIKATEY